MRCRAETDTSLWCGACKTMHPKSDFGRDRNARSGYAHACTAVVKDRNRVHHANNREANIRRYRGYRRARKQSPDAVLWVLKKMVSDASRRAQMKGLEFRLTPSDLVAPEVCPVFGRRLIYQATSSRVQDSASLDRINSTRGYTPDNVWIISWRANQIKSDATADELRAVAAALDLHDRSGNRLLDGREWNEYPKGRHD